LKTIKYDYITQAAKPEQNTLKSSIIGLIEKSLSARAYVMGNCSNEMQRNSQLYPQWYIGHLTKIVSVVFAYKPHG